VLEEASALAAAGQSVGSATAHGTAALLPARYASARRRSALALAARTVPDVAGLTDPPLLNTAVLHRRLTQGELDELGRALVLSAGAGPALAAVGVVVSPLLAPADDGGVPLPPDVVALILAAQGGRCLVCGQTARRATLVPLLPRSRLRLDALENLLAVDERCARSRGHALAALRVVWAWSRRAPVDAPVAWPGERDRVRDALVGVLAQVPAGLRLWDGHRAPEVSRGDEGRRVAALLA
jgi:hypothetical protein